ncbi:MAG TPA: amino acid permease [Steroidobacteraceae bacterium]|nr:amino acid permease [Steroidobacteraceae bacterium]
MSRNPDSLLARELGVRQLAANIFNYTVGSGIFALPAFAVLQLGSAAPLAYLTCAVVIGLVVMCFAEAGSRVDSTGGPYAYVETALGPFVGFVAGCLVLSTGTSAAAGIFSLLARSVVKLFPAAPAWITPVIIVALVVTLVSINVRGVKTGARVIEAMTVIKLVPLLGFVAVGVFFVRPQNWVWEDMPSLAQVLSTSGIVLFAFSGIEGSLVPSGEVRNPSRSVPRAALLALSAVTLLYLAVQFVALGAQGLALADDRTTPLASAASHMVGPTGRSIMIVAAVISMTGYLSANVLSEPRGVFAFSRDGFLPRFLSTVHPRFRTPHYAIYIYGAVVTAIALSGTFEQLATFSNLAALMLYFLVAISAWQLRRRDVRSDGEPFTPPGRAAVNVAACVAVALVFYQTVERTQFLWLLGVLVLICALYGIRGLRGNTKST